jgi:hypothetical protein
MGNLKKGVVISGVVIGLSVFAAPVFAATSYDVNLTAAPVGKISSHQLDTQCAERY